MISIFERPTSEDVFYRRHELHVTYDRRYAPFLTLERKMAEKSQKSKYC